MHIRLFDRLWQLVWVKRLYSDTAGVCDHPDTPGKKIRILKNQEPKEELRLLLHEFLHACNWWADEEWVDMASSDIANGLWKLGWRKMDRPRRSQSNKPS